MTESATFEIVPIPIGTYRYHPSLDSIDTEAERIVEILTQFGGHANIDIKQGYQLDEIAVKNRLHAWATRTDAPSGVLLWIGHGASDGDDAWLATFETPDPIIGNGLVPKTMADQIASDWRRRAEDDSAWALVIIEACGAGRFVNNLIALLTKHSPRRLAIVGVGGDGAAHLGGLRDALSRTDSSYTVNDEYIQLRDMLNRLEDFLPDDVVFRMHVGGELVLRRHRLIETPVSTSIDNYQTLVEFLAKLSPDERSHFIPKAQGAEHGELAWYFVGRISERRRISAWLRDSTSGMLIVTGRAGTGKSAVLGNVLIHTNPELRELLIACGQLEREVAEHLPPSNVFDVVIHLTGVTTSELVKKLSSAAGIDWPTATTADPGRDFETVLSALRLKQFTILVDALDEAQEPATIASAVLQRLATLPRTRVVVGTRSSTNEGPDQPYTDDQDLIDALGRANASVMTIEREPTAVATYIRLRLTSALGRETSTEEAINRFVKLSSTQEREFLFARLAVHEVIAQRALLFLESREKLDALLTGDHRTLFAAAVARLTANSDMARPLLEALALARGRGLPRADQIWATVTTAVAKGCMPHESDIDNLLTTAAPYIMLDAEYGQSVYRLAHQTFREYFLSDVGLNLRARHASIVHALMANAADCGVVNRYIVHRLAEHVAEAQAWQELADARAVLDQLDPESVAAEAFRAAYGLANLPLAITASLSARYLLSSIAVADRWMARQITMACIDSHEASTARRANTWTWPIRRDPLHLLLPGHRGPVQAITSLRMPDGRVLLASSSDDGTIRFWDPSTGRPVGDPLEAMNFTRLRIAAHESSDCRATLVIGDAQGRLRLWDVAGGRYRTEPLAGHLGSVVDITCLSNGPRDQTIVTCGFDRTVLLWHVTIGRPIVHETLVSDYRVRTMSSLLRSNGQSLLITGGYDGDIRVWHSEGVKQRRLRLPGYVGSVHALTACRLADNREVIAIGGDDAITVTDLHGDNALVKHLVSDSGAVYALAALLLPDGRTLLASACEDGTIRLWDPVTGLADGEPLTGHTGPVRTLTAVAVGDGRELLASGGEDHTVRIWDPTLARRASSHPSPPASRPRAMTTVTAKDGQVLLVTGDADGIIQFRDFRTGAAAGISTKGDIASIHVVISFELQDGRTMVAASGSRGSIVRWVLDSRRAIRIGTALYGHTATVRAMTPMSLWNKRLALASAGNDDKIRLWDAMEGASIAALPGGHRSAVNALITVTMPEGPPRLVSAGEDMTVILWDIEAQAPAVRVDLPSAGSLSCLTCVFEDNNQWLAAGAQDGAVHLLDSASLQLVDKLAVGRTPILSLSTVELPSGRQLLAAGYADGFLRIWDVIGRSVLRAFPLPFEQIPRKLASAEGRIAIQTDVSVIVAELDQTIAES